MCPDSQNNRNDRDLKTKYEVKLSDLNHRVTLLEEKLQDVCVDLYGHGLEREGLVSLVLDLREKIDRLVKRSAKRESMYWALILMMLTGFISTIWRLLIQIAHSAP